MSKLYFLILTLLSCTSYATNKDNPLNHSNSEENLSESSENSKKYSKKEENLVTEWTKKT